MIRLGCQTVLPTEHNRLKEIATITEIDVSDLKEILEVYPDLDPHGSKGRQIPPKTLTQQIADLPADQDIQAVGKHTVDAMEAERVRALSELLEKLEMPQEAVRSAIAEATVMKDHWDQVYNIANGSKLSMIKRLQSLIEKDIRALDEMVNGDDDSGDDMDSQKLHAQREYMLRTSIAKNVREFKELTTSLDASVINMMHADIKRKEMQVKLEKGKSRPDKPGFASQKGKK